VTFPRRVGVLTSVRKMQSYNPSAERRSFRLYRWPIRRQYFSSTSARDMRRWAASRSISTSLIHTYPGAPVQQLPHWLHVKLRPSAYQGAVDFSTSNFIAPAIVGNFSPAAESDSS
jgi:hypothetical protein